MNRRSFLKSLVALTTLTAVGHKAAAQAGYIDDFRVTIGMARYSGPTRDALDGGLHHIALTRGQSGFRLYFDKKQVQDIIGIDVSMQDGVMSIVRDAVTPGEKPRTILNLPAVTSRRSILDYTLSSRQNLPSNENRVFGNLYDRDSLSDRPELSTAPLDLSGDFTIEFWVNKPTSPGICINELRVTSGIARDPEFFLPPPTLPRGMTHVAAYLDDLAFIKPSA